ncbi:hypothetical protein [Tritonibacter scottomollicae]|uniref:Uncharacterized protein n=1 Tax=Tritonibacter scottomollicae TaxID=483013 RepID=A0A2T1AJ30_TRISK|nr:hypothetical protein [Tritonibacter scottomollicae]PRZ48328.1 hypothetical protein CLV89_104156 [Tritonibacter scottomollicae]
MQIAKFMDPRRVAVRPDTDDKPISGGISSVLGRGYPAQLANMKVDHLLMAASAEELQRMAERWGIPVSIIERRSRALANHAAHLVANRKG